MSGSFVHYVAVKCRVPLYVHIYIYIYIVFIFCPQYSFFLFSALRLFAKMRGCHLHFFLAAYFRLIEHS